MDIQAPNSSRHDNKNHDFFRLLKRAEIAWESRVSSDQSERPLYSRLCIK